MELYNKSVKQFLLIQYDETLKDCSVVIVNQNGVIVSSCLHEKMNESFVEKVIYIVPSPLETVCVCDSIEEFRAFMNAFLKNVSRENRNFVFSLKTKFLTFYANLNDDVKAYYMQSKKEQWIGKETEHVFYVMHQLLNEYLISSKGFEQKMECLSKSLQNKDVQNITLDDLMLKLSKKHESFNVSVRMEKGIPYYKVEIAGQEAREGIDLNLLYTSCA